MTLNTKICVAGCGRMGLPMLVSLRTNGFIAHGFDIRPSDSFGDSSLFVTDQVDAVDPATEILISVVRDIAQTEALLFDTQNLLSKLPNLRFLIISSTVSPKYIAKLKTEIAPIRLIDAPMSGAAHAAQAGTLSFMIGGTTSNVDKLEPMFRAMGRHIHHMGDTGSGMSAKVLNNLLAAATTATTRMVLDWADKMDVDADKLLGLVSVSSGQNWFASGFEQIEFARDGFAEDNSIGILKKDVQSALDAAPDGADTRIPELLLRQIGALVPRD